MFFLNKGFKCIVKNTSTSTLIISNLSLLEGKSTVFPIEKMYDLIGFISSSISSKISNILMFGGINGHDFIDTFLFYLLT